MFADYHMHCRHSMDGLQTMEEACRAALAAGLDEICFTDHIEPGHPDPGTDVPIDMDARAREMEAARAMFPQLKIRNGIEIGDNPVCRTETLAYLNRYPLDYRLLSMHLIDGVDAYYDPSFNRPSYFEGKTRAEAYKLYARCRLEQLRAWDPADYDGLAHFGFVAKFAPYPAEIKPFLLEDAPEEIDEALRLLAKAGKPLEINTSGWKTTSEPLPARGIVRRFREVGGEFVIFGSDSHMVEYVGYRLKDARQMALDCGFRYAVTFEKREMKPYRIEA